MAISQPRMGSNRSQYDYVLDANMPKKPLKLKYKTEGGPKKPTKKKSTKKK